MNTLKERKWIKELDISNLTKEDIDTYSSFSHLVSLVRLNLNHKPNNPKLINRYFDIMLFVFKNYNVNQKHFNYIKEKSNLNLKNDYLMEVIFERERVFNLVEKDKLYRFNYEFNLRPLESIFGFEENIIFERDTLFNSFSKQRRSKVEEKNFKNLKDLFWVFVDEATFYKRKKVA